MTIRPAYLLLLLALLSMGCGYFTSFSVRYTPKYTPGDDYSDHLDIQLRAWPPVMVKPGPVTYTAIIRGELPECGSVMWTWPDGSVSSSSGCGLAVAGSRTALVKCIGLCTTALAVFGADGKQMGRGWAAVQIGGESE